MRFIFIKPQFIEDTIINFKSLVHSISLYCLCAIAFSLLGSTSALSREFVIIGTPQVLFKDNSQKPFKGIDIDVVKRVMQQLDLPYRIELPYSSRRNLHLAQAGEVDMILSLSKSSQRQDFLTYPEISYKEVSWHFFALKENRHKFEFKYYRDLKDVLIGAVHGNSYSEAFWQADLRLMMVADSQLLLGMLFKKRVDLIPMNKTDFQYQIRQMGRSKDIYMLQKPIQLKAYYNVFPKKSNYPNRENIIKRYDEIVAKMLKDGDLAKIYLDYGLNR